MATEPFRIKLLGAYDVEPFKAIRLEALRVEPDNFASSAADWEGMTQDQWMKPLTDNHVVVASDDTGPIGIMGLMPQRASKMAHRATLIMVYTTPAYRGQGISTSLLRRVIEIAKDQGIVQLELSVSCENTQALGFYERQGFAKIGRIPGGFRHEGREIDDILMARRI